MFFYISGLHSGLCRLLSSQKWNYIAAKSQHDIWLSTFGFIHGEIKIDHSTSPLPNTNFQQCFNNYWTDVMKFCTDIHGFLKMNPSDFDDSQTSRSKCSLIQWKILMSRNRFGQNFIQTFMVYGPWVQLTLVILDFSSCAIISSES